MVINVQRVWLFKIQDPRNNQNQRSPFQKARPKQRKRVRIFIQRYHIPEKLYVKRPWECFRSMLEVLPRYKERKGQLVDHRG